MADDIQDVVYNNDDLIVPVGDQGETGPQGPPGAAGGTTAIMQTFANAAARAAATPTFDGQLGVQIDTNTVYQALGITVGNWGAVYATRTFVDGAARTAAVPDFDGQVGVQLDTNVVYVSTGVSAGNWTTPMVVSSAGSSTDNAIVRWDGTTGTIIQDYTSGAPTISDTGNITVVGTTQIAAGTSTSPSLKFTGATTSGLSNDATDFHFLTGGTSQMQISNSSGNVNFLASLTFTKEINHTVTVSDTTTPATVGGNLTISAGKAGTSGTGGLLILNGGVGGTTGIGGQVSITSGAGGTTSGQSGAIALLTATETGAAATGQISIRTGDTESANSGAINVISGTPLTSGNSGVVTVRSGDSDTLGASGSLILETGDSLTSGNTGNVHIETGEAVSGNSGDLELLTGDASGTKGIIGMYPGGVTATEISTTLITNSLSLKLRTGTATAGTFPLKFVAGTNLTAPEAGAMEWDGTRGYLTQTSGPTRKTIAYTTDFVLTTRTVYVDYVNGDDATAVIGDISNPYQTKAAALADAKADLSPTSADRVLISVAMGTSSDPIVYLSDTSGVDWDLNGGSITVTSGSSACIDDGNFIVDTVIYNAGIISRTTAGTQGAVRTQNASTLLKLSCVSLVSSVGNTVTCTNGTQIIEVVDSITCSVNSGTTIVHTAGNQSITVLGTTGITATGTSALGISCAAGLQRINSHIITSTDDAVTLSGGTSYVNSNISVSAGNGLSISAGTLYHSGNNSVSTRAIYSTGGTVISRGIITGSETIYMPGGSGSVTHYGDIVATTAGVYVPSGGSGTITVYGNITGTSRAVDQRNTVTIVVNGNVSSSTTNQATVLGAGSGGSITINGNVSNTAASGTGWGVYNNGSGTAVYVNNGIITSSSAEGLNHVGGAGVTVITNCKISSTLANREAIEATSTGLILKNCTIVSDTGATYSINTSATPTIKIYGSCEANKAINASVTLQVGTLIIDSNVS